MKGLTIFACVAVALCLLFTVGEGNDFGDMMSVLKGMKEKFKDGKWKEHMQEANAAFAKGHGGRKSNVMSEFIEKMKSGGSAKDAMEKVSKALGGKDGGKFRELMQGMFNRANKGK